MTNLKKIKSRLKNISHESLLKLNDNQLDFIVHPINESCYLKACPGSGKTEVVGIKAAYEISNWKNKYSGIAVLSFTKNAAKEIKDRVDKYDSINGTRHPHFIGTIDSWLHSFILHPFGHKIFGYKGVKEGSERRQAVIGDKSYSLIDNDSDSSFLDNDRYKISYEVPIIGTNKSKKIPYLVNKYYITIKGEYESNNHDSPIPDSISKDLLKEKKTNFLTDGFATYQDAEYLCYKVLKHNEDILKTFAKRFPTIIIDECQDLSVSQIYLFHLLKEQGVTLIFIGDINQAIYEFRKVDIAKFNEFLAYHKIQQKELLINYRSNQHIVNMCQHFAKTLNDGNDVVNVDGLEPILHETNVFVWEYDDLTEIPQKFINFIHERNAITIQFQHEQGISIQDAKGIINIQKSAILSRGKGLLADIRPNANNKFDKIELFANSLNCWNIVNRTNNDIQNSLQDLGKSISILAYQGRGSYQNQFCPEGLGHIEWRMLLYDIIEKASKRLYPFNDISWSEWTKSLKLFLKEYWEYLPLTPVEWSIVENKFRVKSTAKKSKSKKPTEEVKNKDKKVIETLKTSVSIKSNEIRLTTIHDVKGETLDAILLVSSKDKKSKGGHFEHWLGNGDKQNYEFVRFAYVACSRPKHLLIWAIPKISQNPHLKTLQAMGFK